MMKIEMCRYCDKEHDVSIPCPISLKTCVKCETYHLNPESDTCDCGGKLA